MRVKNEIYIFTLILIACVGIILMINNRNIDVNEDVIPLIRRTHDSIFDFDKDVWATYLLNISYNGKYSDLQDNHIDYVNYGFMASTAVTCLYEYNFTNRGDIDYLNKALLILNNLKNTFHRYGYFPRPEYNEFEYGWVSSMDAPVIALAAQMAYEITYDEQWYTFRNDLINYCKKSTKEHGFLLQEKDGNIWPLEYAEKKITEENAEYVYNGSLFGYQALEMLASVCEDEELCNILDQILYNLQKKSSKYIYNSGEWLWYCLNPKIINQEEKVIRELHALESLSKILPDCSFFSDEKLIRERIFSKLFKVVRVGSKGYFWRASGPHPYIIDIMPTLLEIYDDKGNILDRHYMNGLGFNDSWMIFDLPENAKYANIYAAPLQYESNELLYKTLLCKSDIEAIDSKLQYDVLQYSMQEKDNGFNLELKEKIDFTEHFCIFGIELENNTDKVYDIRLLFNDGMHRYYTPIKPGKNLILINTLGIRNSDSSAVKNIKDINLRFFSQDSDIDIKNIKVNNVILFNNFYEIYEYQKKQEYMVNFQ